jgi:hypothetical protein
MRLRAAARLAICAAALLTTSTSAVACVPAPGWPEKVSISVKQTAELLAQAAVHIDLVEVERFSDDFEYATRSGRLWSNDPADVAAMIAEGRQGWADYAVRIHYRVLETLKGPPHGRFELNGVRYVPIPAPKGAQTPKSRNDAPTLTALIDQYDLADAPSVAPCENPISGELGGKYLVLRDADGHPLNHPVPMRFDGEVVSRSVASVVPVSGADSQWVVMIRQALKTTPAAK